MNRPVFKRTERGFAYARSFVTYTRIYLAEGISLCPPLMAPPHLFQGV